MTESMLDRLEYILIEPCGLAFDARLTAKEILEELLNPTKEMIKAGYSATDKWWDIKGGPEAVKAEKMRIRWRAMINEALKDE
jgi:hypothetical protein